MDGEVALPRKLGSAHHAKPVHPATRRSCRPRRSRWRPGDEQHPGADVENRRVSPFAMPLVDGCRMSRGRYKFPSDWPSAITRTMAIERLYDSGSETVSAWRLVALDYKALPFFTTWTTMTSAPRRSSGEEPIQSSSQADPNAPRAPGPLVAMALSAHAQTPLESSYEIRFQARRRVPQARSRFSHRLYHECRHRRSGKDCNLRVVFIDRITVNAPDGTPVGKRVEPTRVSRGAGEGRLRGNAQLVIGGLTADSADAPGPFATTCPPRPPRSSAPSTLRAPT